MYKELLKSFPHNEIRLSDTTLFSLKYNMSHWDFSEIYKVSKKTKNVDIEPQLKLNQNGLKNNSKT